MYRLLLLLLLPLGACVRPERTEDPMARLEMTLRAILARHPDATVGIAVRDVGSGRALDVHADRVFHAASTMKVPVMIEVYRQAEEGRFSLEDRMPVRNEFRSIVDGSPYQLSIGDDSDEAIYNRIGEEMTVRDLVYQMITVSSNLATNLLIDRVAAPSVQQTIERLGTRTMRVLRGVEDGKAYAQGLNNTATAADLATLLAALAEGRAVSPAADRRMVEVLLDQRFNEMIPAGLPEGTRVAHKTGNITAIHHDAGIVYPAAGAPYVLVVLIEGIHEMDASAALGAEIARAVHAALR